MNNFQNLLVTALLFCAAVIFMAVDYHPQQTEMISSETTDSLLVDATAEKIDSVITSYKGEKAVLVNVWATWCAPCIEEFPEIVKLQRAYPEKLKVIFVSADFPNQRDNALAFLKKQNVDWTTYFKKGKDQDFIEAISTKWTGALPFTKVISTSGETVASWEQSASYEKFKRHVKTAINQ